MLENHSDHETVDLYRLVNFGETPNMPTRKCMYTNFANNFANVVSVHLLYIYVVSILLLCFGSCIKRKGPETL